MVANLGRASSSLGALNETPRYSVRNSMQNSIQDLQDSFALDAVQKITSARNVVNSAKSGTPCQALKASQKSGFRLSLGSSSNPALELAKILNDNQQDAKKAQLTTEFIHKLNDAVEKKRMTVTSSPRLTMLIPPDPKAGLSMHQRKKAAEANDILREKRQSAVHRTKRKSYFMQTMSDGEIGTDASEFLEDKKESRDSRDDSSKRESRAVQPYAKESFNKSRSILRKRGEDVFGGSQTSRKSLAVGSSKARSSVYVTDGPPLNTDQPVEDQLVGQYLSRIHGLMKKLEPDRKLPSHWEKRTRNGRACSFDSFPDFDYGRLPKGRAGRSPSPNWQNRSHSPHSLSPSRCPYLNQNLHSHGQSFDFQSPESAAKTLEYVPSPDEEKSQLYREETRRYHELGLVAGPSSLANRASAPRVFASEDIQVYAPVKLADDSKAHNGAQMAEPTTLIEADVVCGDGSSWPVTIQTNVIDWEGPEERCSKFVMDFRVRTRGEALRIRVDVGCIKDVKTTAGAADGTGLQYFVLVNSDGILEGSGVDGIQDLPDLSAKVLHLSGLRCYEDARNFFAELLILAQFLAQNS